MSRETSHRNSIVHALDRFCESPGDRRRLTVESEGCYAVVRGDGEGETVHIEVSAGRQLPKGKEWTPEEAQHLYDMGLRQGRASMNFRGFCGESALVTTWGDRLAWIVAELFHSPEGDTNPVLVVEPELEVESQGVVEAMSHLAKNRTWQARTGLYRKLLEARFLVLVEGESGEYSPSRSISWHPVGALGSWPVVAAFTSYDTLDLYAPLGKNVLAIPGEVLFPMLAESGVGALQLNPGSSPNGELSANEITMLVDGLKKLSGIH